MTRKPWTREEELRLIEIYEAGRGAPMRAAAELGRSREAIEVHFSRMKVDPDLPYSHRRRARAICLPRGPAKASVTS